MFQKTFNRLANDFLLLFVSIQIVNSIQRIMKDKKFRTNEKGILKQVTSDSSVCF